MSKVQLQGNVSGTGVFTIASPNSNTDRTLTLPDNSGTILTGSSAIQRSQLPTGSVLQVVNATSNSASSTNQPEGKLTAVTANITPTSASSRILILARMPFLIARVGSGGGGTAAWTVGRILRNGSAIQPNPTANYEHGINFGDNNWNDFRQTTFIQSLDSPNTTSSVTYAIQATNYDSLSTLTVNEGGVYFSSLTLMEIAA